MTAEEARRPFNLMNAQNLALIAQIDRPDFDGDHLLDPTTNQALYRIHAANEAVVTYPQGAFPLDFAQAAVDSTNVLLEKCRGRYGVAIVKPMEQAFHRWFALWFYAGRPQHPPEIFRKRIFQQEQDLFDAICTANAKLATLSAADLPRTRPKKRGKSYGTKDETLHKVRAEVVAEMRRRRKATGLPWTRIAALLRGNSAYSARLRGKTDATWIRYAKSGFSG